VKPVWRRRPSPAITIACVALFVALAGTGYAAVRLPANSVGTAQIKNSAVNSLKVKNGSLLRADFKAGQVPAGPAGPAGARSRRPRGSGRPGRPVPRRASRWEDGPGRTTSAPRQPPAGALANSSISFVYAFAAAPTVKIVLQGAAAPAECPGNATFPQAQSGFVCIYEASKTNSVGVTLNGVTRSGATIFTNSSAAGGFFTFGTWAATGA
jgi:hypothetical protein